MPYSLWSHGRLLGESDFELGAPFGTRRVGVFRPTPLGASLLPTLTGIGPALLALGRSAIEDRAHPDARAGDDFRDEPFLDEDGEPSAEAFARSAGGSAVLDFARRLDELALELRDPDGCMLPTESIGVHDMERILLVAGEGSPSPGAPYTPDRPRYFLSATLISRRRTAARRAMVH